MALDFRTASTAVLLCWLVGAASRVDTIELEIQQLSFMLLTTTISILRAYDVINIPPHSFFFYCLELPIKKWRGRKVSSGKKCFASSRATNSSNKQTTNGIDPESNSNSFDARIHPASLRWCHRMNRLSGPGAGRRGLGWRECARQLELYPTQGPAYMSSFHFDRQFISGSIYTCISTHLPCPMTI